MSGVPGRDYIGIGVGGIILGSDGRVLLAQRGPKARNQPGQWENPGGALKFGERFEDAIVREIREELSIEVVVEGLLRVVNHVLPEDGQHWVSPTLVCRYVSGTPTIREHEKCSGVEWFSLDHLPKPMTAISRTDLVCYRQLAEEGGRLLAVEWCSPIMENAGEFGGQQRSRRMVQGP